LRVNLKLTYEEIADGTEKTIKVKKYKTCSVCNGSGAKSGSGYASCSNCNGTGEIRQTTRPIFGQFVNVSECRTCNGEGRIIRDKCDACQGEGRIKDESTIKINIPPGVVDGNYIPLRGQGNVGIRGGYSGDLNVVIEEEKHKYFIRDGDDIIYNLDISIIDAALGAEIVVPTLKGKSKLKIESGTQPGKRLRMKEKGIRHLNDFGRGDQIVIVNVFIPTKLTGKEKEILKELAKSENFNPKSKTKSDKDFFKKIFG